jgi:PAS domain S-box-containing protein
VESFSKPLRPVTNGPGAASRLSPADLALQMVESVSDYAIFALDVDGIILTWNRGAERLKGYTRSEIVGRSFEVFYPEEALRRNFPRYELDVAAREGRFEDEGWRLRKDGSRFWARVVITALYDDAGGLTGYAKVTSDLTERKAAEDALRKSEEQFRLLVQNVQDYAILFLDPDGRVASWNEGAQRLKGYTAEEILGEPFERFYPPDKIAEGFPARELELAARDGSFQDEGWRVRKDGSRFWATVVITALRDEHGRLIGFGKVTHDVTAKRAAEKQARQLAAEQARSAAIAARNDELQALNAQLESAVADAQRARDAAERARRDTEDAYRELDQFAYIASHDLKAPLRGISSLAEWISDDAGDRLGDESARHMRLLQGRVQRLQGLIDGILEYSRAGRVRAKPEPIDTGALVRDVIDMQPPTDVRIEVAARMPTLEAERVPLQQVFMNLIGNSIKYGSREGGGEKVVVSWRDAGDAYEFAVADNGSGIPPEYHDRIWGVFQRLESRDKVEGTGIGLAVVKKIVETRGGRVSLESAPGEGATFRFTWPKAQSGAIA